MKVIMEPVTHAIEFIDTSVTEATEGFVERYGKGRFKLEYYRFEVQQLAGSMNDCLQALIVADAGKLMAAGGAVLFMETDSNWTAIIFGIKGTGCISHARNLGLKLKRQVIHAAYSPHTMKRDLHGEWTGYFGGTVFAWNGSKEVHNPHIYPHTNEKTSLIRTIHATYENKWEFGAAGEVQPFENPNYYKAKKIKERFNEKILDEYLRHFGIRFFDEKYFMPHEKSKAFLLT